MRNGFRKLFWGGDPSKRLEEIEAGLDAAVWDVRSEFDKREQAQKLLDATGRFLPAIINERFRNSLAAKGIVITEPGGEENGN